MLHNKTSFKMIPLQCRKLEAVLLIIQAVVHGLFRFNQMPSSPGE